MLRMVATKRPPHSVAVPYRRGAATTANALADRGLILLFRAHNNGGRRMVLTPAGTAFLATLDPPPAT